MGLGMGFRMNKNIFSFVVIVLIVLNLSSCLKKQDLEDQDLGPAISSDELQNKMGDSIGTLSYSDISKNEISVMNASTIFEDTQVNKRYKQDLYVSQITDSVDQLKIDFLFNKQDYINSDNSFTNQKYQLIIERTNQSVNTTSPSDFLSKPDINKTTANQIRTQADAPVPFFMYRAYVYFAVQACRENKVTCHNLKSETSKMYLNSELASPKICPDINNCLIDIKKIEFDMLDNSIATTNGKPYRTHYTFSVSPQLPFLSKVMRYCVRGLTDYNGRKVLAEDCMSINDFSYGQQR